MFIIVYDESLKEKLIKDDRFSFLCKQRNGKESFVFCLQNSENKNQIDFSSDKLFEYGLNDNPKYQITQVLTF